MLWKTSTLFIVILFCAGSAGCSNSPAGEPGNTITVSPSVISPGGVATLTWASNNVVDCSASGAWSGEQKTSGSIQVDPIAAGNYNYHLICNGEGGSSAADAVLVVAVPMQQRIAAAQQAASDTSAGSPCGAVSQNVSGGNGFYWEIGAADGIAKDTTSGTQASGSVHAGMAVPYTRSTPLMIASASKWIYGAYVLETQAMVQDEKWTIPAAEAPFLNFTSGYSNMADDCSAAETPTVQSCLNHSNGMSLLFTANKIRSTDSVGRFYYNSGHLEVLEGGADPSIATVINGSAENDAGLTTALLAAFSARGLALNLSFTNPIVAGGIVTTSADYATFLQGMLRKDNPLVMSHFLHPTADDSYAVCTSTSDPACVDGAGKALSLYTPTPDAVSWHYSITHWIEDDPTSGDGAYSSPGKFGFYPWIDASKTYYGIVARYDAAISINKSDTPYYKSVLCGEAIRKAFMLGTAP